MSTTCTSQVARGESKRAYVQGSPTTQGTLLYRFVDMSRESTFYYGTSLKDVCSFCLR